MESPYTQAPSLLETVLFELQVRGFRPVLAHPERSMTFLHDRARLERLVEKGVVCSVTAMSVSGAFGTSIKAYTLRLFAAGVVHNIASDAHDATRRAPGFQRALAVLESEFDVACRRRRLVHRGNGQGDRGGARPAGRTARPHSPAHRLEADEGARGPRVTLARMLPRS